LKFSTLSFASNTVRGGCTMTVQHAVRIGELHRLTGLGACGSMTRRNWRTQHDEACNELAPPPPFPPRVCAQPVAELIALLGYFFWSGPTFCRVLVMVQ
jgi:hypothetical protein